MTKTPVMAGDASVRPHNMKNPASPADNAYEIKADDPLMQSFDTLADAEQQGKAIATLSEEMDSVKSDIGGLKNGQEQLASRMDKIARAAQRPAIGDSNDENSASPESKSFINGYLRKGLERELKSFNGATSSDGGYAVPQEIDAAIGRMLTQISPIRSLATVVRTGSAGYRKLVTQGGTPSGWVSELAARPKATPPILPKLPRPQVNFTPILPLPKRCWTMPHLMLKAGWRQKLRKNLPVRRAPPLSMVRAIISQRAF